MSKMNVRVLAAISLALLVLKIDVFAAENKGPEEKYINNKTCLHSLIVTTLALANEKGVLQNNLRVVGKTKNNLYSVSIYPFKNSVLEKVDPLFVINCDFSPMSTECKSDYDKTSDQISNGKDNDHTENIVTGASFLNTLDLLGDNFVIKGDATGVNYTDYIQRTVFIHLATPF